MKKDRILSLMLALAMCVSLAAPAAAESAEGAVIQLTKTEGTVKVSKSSGKNVTLRAKLRLYKGYHVATEKESYAWINLDDTKLIKEDATSEVEVRKSGKKLEVNVSAGNVLFDVSEKLDDNESLNISTSTMVVGVRGTSGWVEIESRWKSRLYVLEGSVQCLVADPVTGQLKSETVKGGEMVECVVYPQDQAGDKCDILRQTYKVGDIPGYVLVELVQDVPLCNKILDETGMDILRTLAQRGGGRPDGKTSDGKTATREVVQEAEKRLGQDEKVVDGKLDSILNELGKQDNNVSTDNVWEDNKPAPDNTVPDRNPITVRPRPDPDPPTPPVPTPTREGYTFDGWFTATTGGTSVTTSTKFERDTTIFARWTPMPTYTVTFSVKGTTVDNLTTDTEGKLDAALLPGSSAAVYANHPDLPFDAWYTAEGVKVDGSTVFAENSTVYARWSGWDLNAAGELVVAGTGPMENYSPATQPWNANSPDITSAVIEDGVTSIGDGAFYNLYSLTDIYYTGTQAQWEAITIGNGNTPLTGANIHYNYTPTP